MPNGRNADKPPAQPSPAPNPGSGAGPAPGSGSGGKKPAGGNDKPPQKRARSAEQVGGLIGRGEGASIGRRLH